MSDSNGYIYDKNGVDLACVKQLKEVERKRIKEYVVTHPEAEYHEGCSGIWGVKCDIALPLSLIHISGISDREETVKTMPFSATNAASAAFSHMMTGKQEAIYSEVLCGLLNRR